MSRGATDLNRGPFDPPAGTEPKGTVTDRKTLQHEYERKLLFKGDKLRYSTNEPVWAISQKQYLAFEFVRATDGELYKTLEERHLPGRFVHQGAILPDAREQIRDLLAVKPLVLHFQPFRYDDDYLLQFTAVKYDGIIDQKRCVILERIWDPRGHYIESLWLDPEQGFCIRRLLAQAGEMTRTRLDIFYDRDPDHGPIPKGWKRVEHFSNGEFDRSIEADVVTGKVNHQIADDRFDVEFPINTLVRDASGPPGREPVEYIVRADDKKRIVLPGEMTRARTAEELISTETGRAGLPEPKRSRWLGIVLAASAVLISVLMASRILRKRSA